MGDPPTRKNSLYCHVSGVPQAFRLHWPPDGDCRAAQIRRCGAAIDCPAAVAAQSTRGSYGLQRALLCGAVGLYEAGYSWAVCASGLSGQVRPFRRVYSGASATPGPRRGARDAPPQICRSHQLRGSLSTLEWVYWGPDPRVVTFGSRFLPTCTGARSGAWPRSVGT